MKTSVEKIWTTETGEVFTETNNQFKDWRDAHSSVLFSVLRAIEEGAKVKVWNQDGLNAQLEIFYQKEKVTCEINLGSM